MSAKPQVILCRVSRTIYGKVTTDSFILHRAFPIPITCTEQPEHMQDPTQEAGGCAIAAG